MAVCGLLTANSTGGRSAARLPALRKPPRREVLDPSAPQEGNRTGARALKGNPRP
jgi:hypothetical protein